MGFFFEIFYEVIHRVIIYYMNFFNFLFLFFSTGLYMRHAVTVGMLVHLLFFPVNGVGKLLAHSNFNSIFFS